MMFRNLRCGLAALTCCCVALGAAACSSSTDTKPSVAPNPTSGKVTDSTKPAEAKSDKVAAAAILKIADGAENAMFGYADRLAEIDGAAQDVIREVRNTVYDADGALRKVSTDDQHLQAASAAYQVAAADAIAAFDTYTTADPASLKNEDVSGVVAAMSAMVLAANDLRFAALLAKGDLESQTAPSAAVLSAEDVAEIVGSSAASTHTMVGVPPTLGICADKSIDDSTVAPVITTNSGALTDQLFIYQRTRIFASVADAEKWLDASVADAKSCTVNSDNTAIKAVDTTDDASVTVSMMGIDLAPSTAVLHRSENVVFTVMVTGSPSTPETADDVTKAATDMVAAAVDAYGQ